MNRTEAPPRAQRQRRQRIILVTGVAVIAAYYLFRFLPASLGTGFALTAVAVMAAVGVYVAGFAKIADRRRRFAYLALPMVALISLSIGLVPNYRRASLARNLRLMGADVTTTADEGDGVWFRFHGIYLPCWMQEQLGDGFFGPIDTVSFSGRDVPIGEVEELQFTDAIGTLNLSYANISNDDLVRLTRVIDARELLINSIPVDATTMDSLAVMPSLQHLAMIETKVSLAEATEFIIRYPKINVVHGDHATGWGFVRLPVAPTTLP